ncbi:MAG: bacteriohemerythrin [Chloroflexi bacterium]|nr:bacteriohemerythrin [Chloroflexota bacterium]
MAVQWTPDLSVGVNEIDNQHKELFSRVNALLDAMVQGLGKFHLDKTINFLGEYVVSHFGTEEKYMKQLNYPRYASHKIEHDAFVKQFGQLKKTLDNGEITTVTVIQVQRQLMDWLKNHIGNVDKALGAFLNTDRKAA